jgi:hypothetical protein
MAILNVFNLGFKVDNDYGLMVEGGGVLHRRRGGMAPWVRWHKSGGGGARLAARPEEDEGGRAPVVRERRGGALGWWVG